ncbi:DUF3574 domain-containing protein [Azospirillum sp.]|uniref:DUF3574 domain-containing protein n=1 Tax=Azospirillum sp. TaxID=34012 RepID=UPI003D70C678
MAVRSSLRRFAALSLLALSGCAAACPEGLTPGVATTLFFGTARRNAPDVGEAEWRAFLTDTAVPRLSGLTVTEGLGLYREKDGSAASERSKVMVTAHQGTPDEMRAIAEVMEAYKSRFDQWGVGRLDQPACTGFD